MGRPKTYKPGEFERLLSQDCFNMKKASKRKFSPEAEADHAWHVKQGHPRDPNCRICKLLFRSNHGTLGKQLRTALAKQRAQNKAGGRSQTRRQSRA